MKTKFFMSNQYSLIRIIGGLIFLLGITIAIGGYLWINQVKPPIQKVSDFPSMTIQNITFKYDPTWKIDGQSANRVDMHKISGNPTNPPGDFSMGEEWFSIIVSKESFNTVIKQTTGVEKSHDITMQGYRGKKLQGYSGIGGSVFFIDEIIALPNKVVIFQVSTQDPSLEEPMAKELDTILSTVSLSQ